MATEPAPFVDGIELRRSSAADDDLIRRVLSLASDWRNEQPGPLASDVNPAYYADWGRPDDLGMLAFEGPWFAGGAYARRVGPADGTYGYCESDLWELTIGVEPARRGGGLGRLLLESLKALSLERGVGGLSLSVELDNGSARRLYEAANFSIVEERETDLLMAWRLARRGEA